ncbi:MAG: hypothetical protein NC827_00665 [Candidatus Omnitrophica bacterium]|nr:hypothetical protein [Candidatus Omnitrophota bacterium]MCM8801813.1 hypothetical protein [Candidatus Omnitrophota bacterium]
MKKIVLFLIFCIFSLNSQNILVIEGEDKTVNIQKGVEIISDNNASGQKALKVPSIGVPDWNIVYFTVPIEKDGKYRFKIRYKLENACYLGKGWRTDIKINNILEEYGVIYGYKAKNKNSYNDYSIDFILKEKNQVSFYMRWDGKEGEPIIYIDKFEIERIDDLPDVRILDVFPDKIRYLPNEKGKVDVKIENLKGENKNIKVKFELITDIDEIKKTEIKEINIEPKQIKGVSFDFKLNNTKYGYSTKITLFEDNKISDIKEEFFTVHENPWAIAVCGARDEAIKEYYSPWHSVFYHIGATDPVIKECALRAKKEYVTCTEFFSWSPGEPFYMAPEEEIWIRGNGGNLLRSKREIIKEVSELKKYGIASISYIAQQAMGEKTIEILKKKPYWFAYSKDGDLIEFYKVSEIERQKEFWKNFDWDTYKKIYPGSPGWQDTEENWKKYVEFWKMYSKQVINFSTIGYFVPNYKLKEVIEYIANQVIESTKIFGWEGIRWDCGHLNTGPLWGPYSPYYDFFGNPLAKTEKEMEEQTIENLRLMKNIIRKEFPNFVFGTNFGSFEETRRFPKMVKELCKDGGWLLDEVSYTYNSPTSPYNKWDKYYKVMAEQGDYVLSLGGHYNPFSLNRFGGKYPVDRIYESIFRISGNGHPNTLYYNSQTNVGNFAQFLVRFGKFTFGTDLRRLENPERIINILPSNLWWKETVDQLEDNKYKYLIIHLINPPVIIDIEKNPESILPEPIENIKIILKNKDKFIKAYCLSCESFIEGEKPETKYYELKADIKNGEVEIFLPCLFYWKMVVIKFSK